jgi:hypothetical protein
MKKKEKPYVMNNQEDEDGYNLYPGSAFIYERAKKKHVVSNSHHVVSAIQDSLRQGFYAVVPGLSR